MRRILVTLVVLAALLGAAALLNPSPEQHRDAIRRAIAERSTLERIFGIGVLTAFASSYRSVGVGSYTVVNGRVVSVGAFGLVHVVQP